MIRRADGSVGVTVHFVGQQGPRETFGRSAFFTGRIPQVGERVSLRGGTPPRAALFKVLNVVTTVDGDDDDLDVANVHVILEPTDGGAVTWALQLREPRP